MSRPSEEFVRLVFRAVYLVALRSSMQMLRQPPGRSPEARVAALSDWYNGLAESDRIRVEEVVQMSAEDAVFGFLALLDGVRLTDPPSNMTLYFNGEPVEQGVDMHDLFMDMVVGSDPPAVQGDKADGSDV